MHGEDGERLLDPRTWDWGTRFRLGVGWAFAGGMAFAVVLFVPTVAMDIDHETWRGLWGWGSVVLGAFGFATCWDPTTPH